MKANICNNPVWAEDRANYEFATHCFRAIAETDGAGKVNLYSRRQNEFNKRFPTIAAALAETARPAIVDGEIVALNEQGKPFKFGDRGVSFTNFTPT